MIITSDFTFQTIDIGASPTHSKNASWVESIKVKFDTGFHMIIRQDYIDSDSTRKTHRIEKIYDPDKNLYTSQILPDGKIAEYICGKTISEFEFWFRVFNSL